MTFESHLGLIVGEARSIDSGAGATHDTLVVADGHGGHCTGWIPARLAIRTLCERAAAPGETPRYIGTGGDFPDSWGWAGAEQDASGARLVYDDCAALVAPPSPTSTLAESFLDLDRAIIEIPKLPYRLSGPVSSCAAVRITGARVHGAHAGICRTLLLRAGASTLESLTYEHFLHEVAARTLGHPYADLPDIPTRIIVGALGALSHPDAMTRVDTFEADLSPGDLLLMCSRRLELGDDELTALLLRTRDEPLADVMHALVTAGRAASERPVDTGLALLRRRD